MKWQDLKEETQYEVTKDGRRRRINQHRFNCWLMDMSHVSAVLNYRSYWSLHVVFWETENTTRRLFNKEQF